VKKILIFILLIFSVTGAFSQAPPPAPIDAFGSPIGDNLIILFIIGIAYSLREYNKLLKSVNSHLKIK
jgi:hypothetical protein